MLPLTVHGAAPGGFLLADFHSEYVTDLSRLREIQGAKINEAAARPKLSVHLPATDGLWHPCTGKFKAVPPPVIAIPAVCAYGSSQQQLQEDFMPQISGRVKIPAGKKIAINLGCDFEERAGCR